MDRLFKDFLRPPVIFGTADGVFGDGECSPAFPYVIMLY